MVEVVQMFNGEETRVIGKARTGSGIVKLLKSIDGASSGWSAKLRGTEEDLKKVGALRIYGTTEYCFDYQIRATKSRMSGMLDLRVYCDVVG